VGFLQILEPDQIELNSLFLSLRGREVFTADFMEGCFWTADCRVINKWVNLGAALDFLEAVNCGILLL
jgi:hypothetical protein